MMLPQIATPKYDMIVPSTGETVTYRPYLVKEEKILMIALESQDEEQIEKAVASIITSCVEGGIDVQNLTNFDVEFMFVNLRAKSVGEGIKIMPKCEHCETPNEISIDISNVFIENNVNKDNLLIKLADNLSIQIHWRKVSDKLSEEDKKTDAESIIALISNSIDTIFYGEETFTTKGLPLKEVKDFVENLNADQFKQMTDFLIEAPYLSYKSEYTCKDCNEVNNIELKGLVDFFM